MASKISFASICAATALIAILLCYCLIYYENNINDRYRTLVHDLHTIILYHIIFNIIYGNIIVIIRTFFSSGLPQSVCILRSILTVGTSTIFCLTLNQAVIVQYIYACYFKTVGIINEQFLNFFFKVCNIAIAGYVSAYVVFGNMAPPGPYAYCTNEDKEQVFQPRLHNLKMPLHSIMILFTIILHVILKYSIKRKGRPLQRSGRITIMDIISHWFVLVILLSLGLFVLKRVLERSQTHPPVDKIRLYYNVLLGWGLPAWSFFECRHMRHFFLSRLKTNTMYKV